jgi:DNA-binding response OmpR family regulator
MDDDASVREIAAHILRARGHQVDVVGDGEAAVLAYEAARREGRPHGVVLLDLTIRGGLGGADTIARLKALDASANVVVMTGYSPEIAEKRLKESGVTATLPKPFSAEALWAAVQKALRPAAPAAAQRLTAPSPSRAS